MRFGTPGRKRRGDSPPLFVSRETPAPPRRRRVQGCGGDGGRWRAVRRKAAAQGCGRAGGPDAVRGCGAGLSGHGGPDAVRQGRLPLPFPQAPALLPRRGAGQSLRKARPLFPLPFLPLCARRHPFFSPPLGTGPRPAGTLRRPCPAGRLLLRRAAASLTGAPRPAGRAPSPPKEPLASPPQRRYNKGKTAGARKNPRFFAREGFFSCLPSIRSFYC